jgi:L-fuconolactonase
MYPIFRRAEEFGVPMLILAKPSRLPDLAVLLDRRPELDVVIDHMADCSPDNAVDVQRLLDMARYPKVYVKISHTWGISRESYPWRDTHDLVKMVYQAFGGKRIMWATDWPVYLDKANYSQTLTVARDEMNFIGSNDLEWILGKTALKLWAF